MKDVSAPQLPMGAALRQLKTAISHQFGGALHIAKRNNLAAFEIRYFLNDVIFAAHDDASRQMTDV